MSGHSKWSTIKRDKGINDKARGALFSKLSRGISIAAKQGGANPETNYKLKIAIDTAKASNMPKTNIDRILSKVSEEADLMELVYEGYGPEGVQIIVEVATNNKNRSAQEIKHVFEKGGGRLAGPGAVAFNFDVVGYILITKSSNLENQMLDLIDKGVLDINEVKDGIEVFVMPAELMKLKETLEIGGYTVISLDLIRKPKNLLVVTDEKSISQITKLLHEIDDLEDVQKVFTNFA